MFKQTLVFLLATLGALPALGHEFWISPEAYQIDPGQSIRADLRVGQNFNGSAYSFIPRNFDRFDLVAGDDVVTVDGRLGDRPALNMAAHLEIDDVIDPAASRDWILRGLSTRPPIADGEPSSITMAMTSGRRALTRKKRFSRSAIHRC